MCVCVCVCGSGYWIVIMGEKERSMINKVKVVEKDWKSENLVTVKREREREREREVKVR